MKVRLKKTGEIINIAEYDMVKLDKCDSYGCTVEVPYEEVEQFYNDNGLPIDTSVIDSVDYEKRRYEIAKAMLPAIYLDDGQAERADDTDSGFEYKSVQSCAREAVRFADALIEELKKKRK